MAANKLIVKDATGVIDKMVVTDSGQIGVNITNPIYQLQIVGTGDPKTALMAASMPGRAVGYLPGDSPGFSFFRNNDSTVNGGMPRQNDRLGYLGFGTKAGTADRWTAMIQAFAETDATTTAASTYLSFGLAANSLSFSERMRLTSVGYLGIGTTNPTQRLEVNGGIRINTSTARPTCSSTTRGVLWFRQNATGVADTLQVCAKDSLDAYSWNNLY